MLRRVFRPTPFFTPHSIRWLSETSVDGPIGSDEFARMLQPIVRAIGPKFQSSPLIVGVSGGVDSTALAFLLSRWVKEVEWGRRKVIEETEEDPFGAGLGFSSPRGTVSRQWGEGTRIMHPSLIGVHVDHGLRDVSGEEAAHVEKALGSALGLDILVHSLHWGVNGVPRSAHVQERAREGRWEVLLREAKRRKAAGVFVAHHAGDQAETVGLRLGRASGLRGLGGMRPVRWVEDGIAVGRVLLGVGRNRIQATVEEAGLSHLVISDASNHDPKYDRTRARVALSTSPDVAKGLIDIGQVSLCVADAIATKAATLAKDFAAVEHRSASIALDLVGAAQSLQHPSQSTINPWTHPNFTYLCTEYGKRAILAHLLDRCVQAVSGKLHVGRSSPHRSRASSGEKSLRALEGAMRRWNPGTTLPHLRLDGHVQARFVRLARDGIATYGGGERSEDTVVVTLCRAPLSPVAALFRGGLRSDLALDALHGVPVRRGGADVLVDDRLLVRVASKQPKPKTPLLRRATSDRIRVPLGAVQVLGAEALGSSIRPWDDASSSSSSSSSSSDSTEEEGGGGGDRWGSGWLQPPSEETEHEPRALRHAARLVRMAEAAQKSEDLRIRLFGDKEWNLLFSLFNFAPTIRAISPDTQAAIPVLCRPVDLSNPALLLRLHQELCDALPEATAAPLVGRYSSATSRYGTAAGGSFETPHDSNDTSTTSSPSFVRVPDAYVRAWESFPLPEEDEVREAARLLASDGELAQRAVRSALVLSVVAVPAISFTLDPSLRWFIRAAPRSPLMLPTDASKDLFRVPNVRSNPEGLTSLIAGARLTGGKGFRAKMRQWDGWMPKA